MFRLKKYFRILQIKKNARFIAVDMGCAEKNGWIYDDRKMRIVTDQFITDIYYPDEHGERRLVFSYCQDRNVRIYREGAWEFYFATCYNTAKTRPK